MRRLALAAVLGASFAQGAAAQAEDHWLILPVVTSADATMELTTSRFYEELAARGVTAWAPENAAKRFEVDGSTTTLVLTDSERAQWKAQSELVLEQLVRGDPTAAQELLRKAALLSLPTILDLNREPHMARQVLDTCLLGVRALLESDSSEQAEAMARECRQLVVAGEATPSMHPPPVAKLLDAADARRTDQASVLHVGSKPSACPVRINGLLLGQTPLEASDLLPGRYAVQVECDTGKRGRVHHADVEPGFTAVEVDARFDSVVATWPTLGLRYSGEGDATAHQMGDAAAIAQVFSAVNLVLVSTRDSTLELELLGGSPRSRVAFARIEGRPSGPTRGDIALAARTLIDGRCMDLTTLPPTVLACSGEPTADGLPQDAWPAARMPRGKFISGMTLFAAGSTSLLTGYVLLGPRARTSEDWVRALDAGQDGTSLQQKWFNMGVGQVVTASVGGAALVTAMSLALPKHDKTPWWAWLSGGVGVGLAAFSVAYGLTATPEPGTRCSSLIGGAAEARTCVERSEQVSVAILTGATAAPLLTIPLVYLFRPTKSKLVPEIELSHSGGYLALRGRF